MIPLQLQIVGQAVELGDFVEVDTSEVTPWRVVGAVIVVVVTFFVSRLARKWGRKAALRIDNIPEYGASFIGSFLEYFVLFSGFVIALDVLGIDFGPLVAILVIALILLFFALRPVIENMASGIILQTRGPFHVGEQVGIEGEEGTVIQITGRTVIIDTPDGRQVQIPNSNVIRTTTVNLTRLDGRRSTLDIGLAYGSPLARAQQVVLAAIDGLEGVRPEPEPEAHIHEFDDSTINLALWFWHDPEILESWRVHSRVAVAVKSALDEAGITIAFPQRTLWWGRPEEHPGAPQPPD